MIQPPFLNLLVYSDSLAFRRPVQPQDLSFTYPFLLKELIESRLGIRTHLVMRGGGGATIATIRATLLRDTGYFGAGADALNIAVIQCGIVDCAPQPFTYALAPALRLVPRVGERVLATLVEHRAAIQSFWSYRVVSKRRFAKEYARLVRTCDISHIRPIAVGMPLPTEAVERRSPGFRSSVAEYNELIRRALPQSYCDIEERIDESDRASFLLDDGHHLTEMGHRLYAEALLCHIQRAAGATGNRDERSGIEVTR